MISPFKFFILVFLVVSPAVYAANDDTNNEIQFSTTLSDGQFDEAVTITFSDSDKTCKLHVKESPLRWFLSILDIGDPLMTDSCSFKPTKRVQSFNITGLLEEEDENGERIKTKGTGEGTILNIVDEYNKIDQAQTIDDLFKAYRDAVTKINTDLPKNQQIPQLTFNNKETVKSVSDYQKNNDLSLPKAYIKMITQYGYPEVGKFIALGKQRSISSIYESDYGYTKKQYYYHKGIEKNKAFYQEGDDVYYIFQDNAKALVACNGEPLVIYTIATEGDYSPTNLKKFLGNEGADCSGFFKFIKNQLVDHFVNSISESINHVLPVYKNKRLKADLTYDRFDNTLDYYFEYNDIFY